MSVLADEVAAHDWSVTGAGICGKPGRSMATLTSQREFGRGVAGAEGGRGRKKGFLNRWGGERDHDVSPLSGVGGGGLYGGVEPLLKVSMMFMRPPQHGHG